MAEIDWIQIFLVSGKIFIAFSELAKLYSRRRR